MDKSKLDFLIRYLEALEKNETFNKKDPNELKDLIEKDGGTSMTCQHCGKKYDFSKEELEQIMELIYSIEN